MATIRAHDSPIFLQFLDALSQLLGLLPPSTFEFTELALVEIAKALHPASTSSLFKRNSEAERASALRAQAADESRLLWDHLCDPAFRAKYVNAAFDTAEPDPQPLIAAAAAVHPEQLHVWMAHIGAAAELKRRLAAPWWCCCRRPVVSDSSWLPLA